MGKKLNIIIIVASLILVAGTVYILFLSSNFERTDPINAVPDDAALIIKIHGPYFNIRPILEENNMWNEILSFPSVKRLNSNFLMSCCFLFIRQERVSLILLRTCP
jgi:hypothetical protein